MKDIKTIEQVIELFMNNSEFNKRALIVRAGNIFINDKGKNRPAEFFLRSFLKADPFKPDNFLFVAVRGENNEKEKDRQIKEIKENCYVFLSIFPSDIQLQTLLFLDEIKANPPYSDFLWKVEEKKKSTRLPV